MKPTITIHLFGRFSLYCDNRELLLHTSSKAKEILCYLIVNRRTAIHRERLAGVISKEPSLDRSRKALRHALWQLRANLAPDARTLANRLVRVEEEWVQFVSDDGVCLDVADFEVVAKDPPRRTHAVELYREELLRGWDQTWCMEERERLRQIYLGTLDALIVGCEAQRDIGAGVAYAMLALHNDQTRECTHRALMRLYAASGDRHSALLQYQLCVEALRELAIGPDDETKALVQMIREGHAPTAEAEAPGRVSGPRLSILPKPAQAAKGRDTPSK